MFSAVVLATIALQSPCPPAADSLVELGWERYRAEQPDAARRAFDEAYRRCAAHVGARVGLGYVVLRADDREAAARWFREVLSEDSTVVDAIAGLGIIAWRNGDLESVRRRFERVLELDPDREDARGMLARLPAGAGLPPVRPPLTLPDSVTLTSRAIGDYFEVRDDSGWRPFYVKGINLGAALPGRHPSQFPDSATYVGWLAAMGEMRVNVIRTYTIHPPHFYGALAEYNRAHRTRPLRLIHGVWAELPPEDDFNDPSWKAEFTAEMRRVVDLLHGRADIAPRPGHSSGFYTADVSEWVLAYIIGREWEPFAVRRFNEENVRATSWQGTYLGVADATPMDVWLAEACDIMIAYETETYRHQRPIAYTSWPTLDPLHHPTETTADEEVALREALGEYVEQAPREYDNDLIALDPSRVRSTSRYGAGFFAAYHAYPYYPDFMVLDPGYGTARSSDGPSHYFGYLQDLKARHPGMPVVIAEYGVPASLGIAHLQPQGWHHGGHSEARMADIDVRMTREIAEAGMAGGALFAWIDEWFKKNWLVIDFEIPLERNRMWINRLDAEQHYGVVALEPVGAVPGRTLDERLEAWDRVPPLYDRPDGRLRAAADEAGLWLLYETTTPLDGERYIGIDVVAPAEGAFRWPGPGAPEFETGVEFIVRATASGVRIMAAPGANPFHIVQAGRAGAARAMTLEVPPLPGLITGRIAQQYSARVVAPPTRDGVFEPLHVVTNRRRFGRDTTEYLALGYDRGILPGGPSPDGYWEWDETGRVLEVRVPWLLINVTDPSSRRVLHGDATDGFGTETVDAIRLVAASLGADGTWRQWPDRGTHPASFSWAGWDQPRWRVRRRPVFDAMRRLFETLGPGVDVREGRAP